MGPLPLVAALPAFAAELESALHGDGEPDLAGQIASLAITHRCRCEEVHCASVSVTNGRTAPEPGGLWNHIVGVDTGTVILDVSFGLITFIEVLDRPDVAATVTALQLPLREPSS